MTALDITVEERASLMERLAELNGRLASDQFVMDNLVACIAPEILFISILIMVPLGTIVFVWLRMSDWASEMPDSKALAVSIGIIIGIFVTVVIVGFLIGLPMKEMSLNRDTASIEAEIETIRGMLE